MTEVSLSRAFARWAHGLSYEDLPAEVVDKVKAILLTHLVAAAIGMQRADTQTFVDLVCAEEGTPGGASIFGRDERVTRGGAALANSEIIHTSGLFDSFRMLTHPGPALVPAALASAELGAKDLKSVITALTAAYEFEARLAQDFVPAVAAHGFRPSPLFTTMGAAMGAAKLLDLDEDRIVAAIAIAANSASGLNEAGRSGGGEIALHEPNAARQGSFAAVMGSLAHIVGSEEIIEGAAGFLNAFAGSATGSLRYVFEGTREISPASIIDGLGGEYRMLDLMFRVYANPGYNQPVIELMGELTDHGAIPAAEITEITVWMNYLETLYPSPEFPRFADPSTPRPGSTHYYAAYVAAHGSFPITGAAAAAVARSSDPDALSLMRRVRVIGVQDQPMFSPEIEITLADGGVRRGSYRYARLAWDWAELVRRLEPAAAGLPGGRGQWQRLVELVAGAETLDSVAPLFAAVRND